MLFVRPLLFPAVSRLLVNIKLIREVLPFLGYRHVKSTRKSDFSSRRFSRTTTGIGLQDREIPERGAHARSARGIPQLPQIVGAMMHPLLEPMDCDGKKRGGRGS